MPPGHGSPVGPGPELDPYERLRIPYDWNSDHGVPQASPPPPLHYPPAGPGGGGRRSNAWWAVVVAVVVAAALIAGGGVLYVSGAEGAKDDAAGSAGGTGGQVEAGGATTPKGSEKVPARTAARLLFQIPSPKDKAKDKAEAAAGAVVPGSWLTGKAYVRTGLADITGYDPDKGTRLWTIPLPGPVCAVTGHITKDHLTAIVHEPAMPTRARPTHGCTQVSALDLDAGRKLWTGSALRGDAPIRFDNITVGASTVAVGGAGGGAGFDIASGTALWTPKANDSCHDAGYGGGPKLVALRECRSDGRLQLDVQTIDPQSGQVIAAYRMTDGSENTGSENTGSENTGSENTGSENTGIENVGIVSTDPLVVAAHTGAAAGDGTAITDFLSIDGRTGKLRTRISAPGERYAAECDVIGGIARCPQVAVGKDRLYLPTKEHDGGAGSGPTNEIAAFDLTTGRRTAQRADAGDGYVISPLRMDGGNVLAYKRSPHAAGGGQVVSIDGLTFEQTRLLENPATAAGSAVEAGVLPQRAEYLYSQGRLYVSAADQVIAYGTG
ncbi:pentapeptide repeat-containing protein [Streptomyces sp. NPDC051243]|uniref:pentapeptide repeat-containing protein n=1 Tax=Streptomyces sp. NPDC051243 TaxID=3365646 RepID=UPI003791ADD2